MLGYGCCFILMRRHFVICTVLNLIFCFCDADLVSQPLFTLEQHKHEYEDGAEPLANVFRPHSISQYLCKQTTRLNFPLESPRMKADITGGYFPYYASCCGPIDACLRYFSPYGSEGVACIAGTLLIRFRFYILSTLGIY